MYIHSNVSSVSIMKKGIHCSKGLKTRKNDNLLLKSANLGFS